MKFKENMEFVKLSARERTFYEALELGLINTPYKSTGNGPGKNFIKFFIKVWPFEEKRLIDFVKSVRDLSIVARYDTSASLNKQATCKEFPLTLVEFNAEYKKVREEQLKEKEELEEEFIIKWHKPFSKFHFWAHIGLIIWNLISLYNCVMKDFLIGSCLMSAFVMSLAFSYVCMSMRHYKSIADFDLRREQIKNTMIELELEELKELKK